jgi:serine protease Do
VATSLVAKAKAMPFNEKTVPQTKADLIEIQNALVESLQRVRKATVSISLGQGFGSGVIVSPDGLVLTAAHVTAGVDKELTVILNDGTKLKAVSMGLVSNTDAAMMRITEEGEYPYVDINKDNNYKLGHWIFALGHSGGFDKERGPVVRLGRIVKDSETTLHSDCKVIGGDSGGPLFDMEGRLIGIHSRVSKTMEQNMHVPMREYIKHWDEMKENKFLGDGPFAKRPVKGSGFLGFGSTDSDDGLLIGKVLKDGPADKAGIKAGDIILKVDDTDIADKEAFKAILKEKSVGDNIKLVIQRKGKEKTIELKLGKK